jgi:hypothetical protein
MWKGTDIPISQNLPSSLGPHGAPLQLRCNFSDCYPSVLSDKLVDFLLVALSCSSSLSTTARLIGDIRVSVLKMFHPPSDTADTHAGISMQTTATQFPSFTRSSMTLS